MFWSAENPKFVFPAYKYALGKNEITGYNDNNVAISFVTQDVTALMGGNYWTSSCASPTLRYSAFYEVPENAIQFSDTYLTNVECGSVNKNTDTSATLSYQQMTNTEPEHYLFNEGAENEKYISACPMIKDIDYSVNALKEGGRQVKYLTREYDLSGKYDHDLYRALNIPEDNVIESLVFQRPAAAFEFQDREELTEKRKKENQSDEYYSGRILEYGIRGFILSYTDDNHVGGEMIPMTYYEFANPVYSNMDYIKINWNTNGFVEVK